MQASNSSNDSSDDSSKAQPAADAMPGMKAGGTTVMFRLGEMDPGATRQIKITGTPQQAGNLTACTTFDYTRGVCTAFNVVAPELAITKTGPEMATVCEPVKYTYTVKNTGKDPAQNVNVYDKLIDGLTTENGKEINFTAESLAPGEEKSFDVMVYADKPMTFDSYAMAKSDLAEVKSKSVSTKFMAPELSVKVQADRPFEYIGKTAGFNVTVTNTGKVASADTVLGLALDGTGAQMAAVNNYPNGSDKNAGDAQMASGELKPDADAKGAYNIGALKPGESRRVYVTADTSAAGRVGFAAVARSICQRDSNRILASGNATAAIDVRAISALQLVVVDKADPVKVGGQTTYEIVVTNEGSAADKNIQLTAKLPDGESFVSAEGETNITAASDGTLTIPTLTTLEAGQKASWYVTIKADKAAGQVVFPVTLKSDGVTKPVSDQEPTRLY